MATILSYALTTLADVKESLGIASGVTSKDNLIIRKINQATEMIEGYCGNRRFADTTYTNEEYDGTGTQQLILRNYPITATQTLSIQQRNTRLNDSDWTTVETDRYFADTKSGVVDAVFTFQKHWNRYRVTYSAGYTTIPADLAEACVELASYLYNNAGVGTAISQKKEGLREIHYHKPESTKSLFESLGIDDVLDRYSYNRIIDDV